MSGRILITTNANKINATVCNALSKSVKLKKLPHQSFKAGENQEQFILVS